LKTTFVTIFFISLLPAFGQQDGAIDDPGDIAFVASSPEGNDGFAFIFLDDCPDATAILFSDDEWTGAAFNGTEGAVTWTNNTGATIERGTVIIIESASNTPTVNIGSAVETDLGFQIAGSSPDELYAYVGSAASPTFIGFIGRLSTGATLAGTGLTDGTTALIRSSNLGSTGIVYTGSTSCDGTLTACQQMFYNDANFSTATASSYPGNVPTSFGGTVLPVELLSLQGKSVNEVVEISWVTATEINNSGFELYHSTNGTNWFLLDFIDGHGDTDHIISYEYVHKSPNSGINYYQLKQLDFDGQYEYLPIISVLFDSRSQFTISPNPAKNHIQFLGSNISGTKVNFLRLDGRKQTSLTIQSNNQLSIDRLPPGQYLVRLALPQKEKILRFIKSE